MDAPGGTRTVKEICVCVCAATLTEDTLGITQAPAPAGAADRAVYTAPVRIEVMPSTASTQAAIGTALVLATVTSAVHVAPGATSWTKYDFPTGADGSG